MIDGFDWARLAHAYGRATDTPGHLAALTSRDERERMDAVAHLDSAILHQGFPGTATAPAARVVSLLIVTDAVDADVRDELVDFLGAVAYATSQFSGDPDFAVLIPELEASIVEGYRAVAGVLDRGAPVPRVRAAEAAVEQLRLPRLASERAPMAARLREWIMQSDENRQVWVRLLGDLGEDVGGFLDGPDRAVRI